MEPLKFIELATENCGSFIQRRRFTVDWDFAQKVESSRLHPKNDFTLKALADSSPELLQPWDSNAQKSVREL